MNHTNRWITIIASLILLATIICPVTIQEQYIYDGPKNLWQSGIIHTRQFTPITQWGTDPQIHWPTMIPLWLAIIIIYTIAILIPKRTQP